MENKKRKAATPPRCKSRINIRDSLPHQCRRHIHRLKSEEDDPEDRETLSLRAAYQGFVAPLIWQKKVLARRWTPSRQEALVSRHDIPWTRLELKSLSVGKEIRSGVA